MHEEWERRDPIKRYEQRLGAEHGFSEDELASIREDCEREVAEAAERALASSPPDPELALEGVFAEKFEPLGDGRAPWSFQVGASGSTARARKRRWPDGRG